MKIGLWSDAVNFPSLPLMKISSYHKLRGDTVKLIDDFSEWFDIVYCSKTFHLPNIRKIPQMSNRINADEIRMGGSGFAINVTEGKERYIVGLDPSLSHDIEHIYPDYTLYSELTKNTAYGFLTRGCPNSCGFCLVSSKEGCKSRQVADLSEFWHGQRNVKLMDANLLACDNAVDILLSLIYEGVNIDYTQGIDARFINEDTAELLCRTNIKMIHFAFDLMKHERAILRGLQIFAKHSRLTDRNQKVYILTNYNTTHEEDWYRVKKVIELGFQPDVRIYQKGTHDRFLTDLSRWANLNQLYRSCSFAEYIPRKDGRSCEQLYQEILRR